MVIDVPFDIISEYCVADRRMPDRQPLVLGWGVLFHADVDRLQRMRCLDRLCGLDEHTCSQVSHSDDVCSAGFCPGDRRLAADAFGSGWHFRAAPGSDPVLDNFRATECLPVDP